MSSLISEIKKNYQFAVDNLEQCRQRIGSLDIPEGEKLDLLVRILYVKLFLERHDPQMSLLFFKNVRLIHDNPEIVTRN